MPAIYAEPVKLLKALSDRIEEGWILIEFKYHQEKLILKKGDSIMKAVVKGGQVEWEVIKDPPVEVRGTERFFVI